jgi:hypothetical protein
MWYYEKDSQPVGPVEEKQIVELIRSGQIKGHTRVWRQGMADWRIAEQTEFGRCFIPSASSSMSDGNPVILPPVTVCRSAYVFKDPRPLTRCVIALLAIGMLFMLSQTWSAFQQLSYHQGRSAPVYDPDNPTMEQALITLGGSCVLLVEGIFFLIWVHMANRNAHALGASGMQFTPGWSVGWFFIPVANLWKPYQAVKETLRASRSPRNWFNQPSDMLVDIWWTLWLMSIVFDRISTTLSTTAVETSAMISASRMTIFAHVVQFASYLATAVLVTSICKAQNSHVARPVSVMPVPQAMPQPGPQPAPEVCMAAQE